MQEGAQFSTSKLLIRCYIVDIILLVQRFRLGDPEKLRLLKFPAACLKPTLTPLTATTTTAWRSFLPVFFFFLFFFLAPLLMRP